MDKYNRKRFNSSMNYKEYFDAFKQAPHKPWFGPLSNTTITVPELSLNDCLLPDDISLQTMKKSEDKIRDKIESIYRPKNVIQEIDECESNNQPESCASKSKSHKSIEMCIKSDLKTVVRLRSQSENISFTFLSFMEKGIQRKLSKEFQQIQSTS